MREEHDEARTCVGRTFGRGLESVTGDVTEGQSSLRRTDGPAACSPAIEGMSFDDSASQADRGRD